MQVKDLSIIGGYKSKIHSNLSQKFTVVKMKDSRLTEKFGSQIFSNTDQRLTAKVVLDQKFTVANGKVKREDFWQIEE